MHNGTFNWPIIEHIFSVDRSVFQFSVWTVKRIKITTICTCFWLTKRNTFQLRLNDDIVEINTCLRISFFFCDQIESFHKIYNRNDHQYRLCSLSGIVMGTRAIYCHHTHTHQIKRENQLKMSILIWRLVCCNSAFFAVNTICAVHRIRFQSLFSNLIGFHHKNDDAEERARADNWIEKPDKILLLYCSLLETNSSSP